MRRLGVLLLAALALGGCESSQEKSARLERLAKLERARNPVQVSRGLSIARASREVRVVATQVLHSSEGTAAVVTLRNTSTHALRAVPIAIAVKDAGGNVLFQNNAPGLEAGLTSAALLRPGEQFTWIDDQVQVSGAGGAPMTVNALVGEAPRAQGNVPEVSVTGVHPTDEAGSSGAAGTVDNGSAVAQHSLVVYGLARRGGRIVAAGRAVLTEVAAHGSSPFQILFIGSAAGAHVEASAPPSTF
ncbi:MAG: hypothetical protein ACRDLF_14030 [Solirubrobacteraceae bacterium]